MPSIAPRYAEGLLMTAKAHRLIDEIGEALEGFYALTQQSAELKEFLVNPVIPAAAKKETARRLLGENAPGYAKNFLFLLIDKGRISKLRDILDCYQDKRMRLDGILKVVITSGALLDDKQIEEISEMYRKKYGAKGVHAQTRVNSALLGGFRVQVGDILTDNSIAGRLLRLKTAIDRINR
jgi:F-type H+-transporting ATPase subunit delta